jgi:hypothetical protein
LTEVILILVNGASNPRARLLRLEIALSWRLDLRGAAGASRATGLPPYEVRELARGEVESVLGVSPTLRHRVEDVDAVAPNGWRCFAAFDEGTPVHRSFVELRPGRPLLFGAITEPDRRGGGAFRATLGVLASKLREAGETGLFSSTSLNNRPSVRAHRAVGFKVVGRSFDAFVRGVSLRALARRLVR